MSIFERFSLTFFLNFEKNLTFKFLKSLVILMNSLSVNTSSSEAELQPGTSIMLQCGMKKNQVTNDLHLLYPKYNFLLYNFPKPSPKKLLR